MYLIYVMRVSLATWLRELSKFLKYLANNTLIHSSRANLITLCRQLLCSFSHDQSLPINFVDDTER